MVAFVYLSYYGTTTSLQIVLSFQKTAYSN